MLHAIIAVAVGVLAAAFLVLFTLAVVRRGRPEQAKLLQGGSFALELAGMLFIVAGVVGRGETVNVVCGLMFLVFATGLDGAPKKGPKAKL